MTGNAQRANGVTIPQLNFSLPVEVLQPLLEFASRYKCGDHQRAGAILNAFNVSDPEVAKVCPCSGYEHLHKDVFFSFLALGNSACRRDSISGLQETECKKTWITSSCIMLPVVVVTRTRSTWCAVIESVAVIASRNHDVDILFTLQKLLTQPVSWQ